MPTKPKYDFNALPFRFKQVKQCWELAVARHGRLKRYFDEQDRLLLPDAPLLRGETNWESPLLNSAVADNIARIANEDYEYSVSSGDSLNLKFNIDEMREADAGGRGKTEATNEELFGVQNAVMQELGSTNLRQAVTEAWRQTVVRGGAVVSCSRDPKHNNHYHFRVHDYANTVLGGAIPICSDFYAARSYNNRASAAEAGYRCDMAGSPIFIQVAETSQEDVRDRFGHYPGFSEEYLKALPTESSLGGGWNGRPTPSTPTLVVGFLSVWETVPTGAGTATVRVNYVCGFTPNASGYLFAGRVSSPFFAHHAIYRPAEGMAYGVGEAENMLPVARYLQQNRAMFMEAVESHALPLLVANENSLVNPGVQRGPGAVLYTDPSSTAQQPYLLQGQGNPDRLAIDAQQAEQNAAVQSGNVYDSLKQRPADFSATEYLGQNEHALRRKNARALRLIQTLLRPIIAGLVDSMVQEGTLPSHVGPDRDIPLTLNEGSPLIGVSWETLLDKERDFRLFDAMEVYTASAAKDQSAQVISNPEVKALIDSSEFTATKAKLLGLPPNVVRNLEQRNRLLRMEQEQLDAASQQLSGQGPNVGRFVNSGRQPS